MLSSVGPWWGDAIAWSCGGLAVLVHSGSPLRSLLQVMAHALISLTPCYFLLYWSLLKRVYNNLYPSF